MRSSSDSLACPVNGRANRDFAQQVRAGDAEPRLGQILDQLARLQEQVDRRLSSIEDYLAARAKPMLTVDEFAQQTGRSAYTVRRWIGERKIDAIRVDGTGPRGRLLIPRQQLDRLLASGLGGQIPSVALGDQEFQR